MECFPCIVTQLALVSTHNLCGSEHENFVSFGHTQKRCKLTHKQHVQYICFECLIWNMKFNVV
jgi:hypothetical protein